MGTRVISLIITVLLALTLAAPASARTNDNAPAFTAVAQAGVFFSPLDATPGPKGEFIYFLATDSQTGQKGVFKTPASDGDVQSVALGGRFVGPTGLAMATDGSQVSVVDPLANAIFSVQLEGHRRVREVPGTHSTAPHVPEVIREHGADILYYSGIDPSSGEPAIFRIPASGGTATVLAHGLPLVDPSGVAVSTSGIVYVVDRGASEGGGAVLKLTDGRLETIASGISTDDHPVGIALTMDNSTLLVSSLNSHKGTAQVLIINLATLTTEIIDKDIRHNHAALGLHRAHQRDFFAWAGDGVVYALE
jgi:hypothetical protein